MSHSPARVAGTPSTGPRQARPGLIGRARPDLLPPPLADPAHLAGRGRLPDHPVDRFGAAAQNDFTGSDPGQTLLNQHFARPPATR